MKTFISDWNEADLSLAKRQQIMRLAISFAALLVPVYVVGILRFQ